jgi:hypothetical protein
MHVQFNEITMECNVLCEQLVEIQKRFKCYNKSLPLDNKHYYKLKKGQRRLKTNT